jgi:hypothetical protein
VISEKIEQFENTKNEVLRFLTSENKGTLVSHSEELIKNLKNLKIDDENQNENANNISIDFQ